MGKSTLKTAKLLLSFIFLIAAFLTSAQSSVITSGQPQKKEQKVKILIKKDGKLIESDTAFVTSTGKGVIYEENGKTFVADSLVISGSEKGRDRMVTIIINEENGAPGNGGKVSTYTYTVGDTLQNDIQRKVIRLGDQKNTIIMQGPEADTFNPKGTSPGTRAVMVEGFQIRDPYSFDATDPGIVSYKKKDIGKGQEKITIIRKKVETPELK